MTRLAGPIEQQRARTAGLLAEATAIAADHAIRGSDMRALPVVLLPANTRPIVPLPAVSREAFVSHVHALLETAFAGAPRDNTLPMSAEDRASRVNAGDVPGERESIALADDVVAASCATCQGECCTAGGNHAFLRQDSVTRVRARLAEVGPDEAGRIASLYVQHLPSHHYRDSCVYHTAHGCHLPRDLRANLCNRYHCGELTQLERVFREHGPAAYVGAASDSQLKRLTLLDRSARGEAVGLSLLSR